VRVVAFCREDGNHRQVVVAAEPLIIVPLPVDSLQRLVEPNKVRGIPVLQD